MHISVPLHVNIDDAAVYVNSDIFPKRRRPVPRALHGGGQQTAVWFKESWQHSLMSFKMTTI